MSTTTNDETPTFIEPRWHCGSCGYGMDAASPMMHANRPKEGDASMCIKCGTMHTRHDDKWVLMTPDELEEFDDETRALITRMQAMRKLVVNGRG